MQPTDRELLKTIGRRAIVAFIVLGVFLLWVWISKPTDARESLLIFGSVALVALMMGLLLSWPRNVLLRAIIILVVCSLAGIRGQLDSFEPVRALVAMMVTAVPGVLIFALVAGADWLFVRVRRKFMT